MDYNGPLSRRALLARAQGALILAVPALLLPATAHAEVGNQGDWRFCGKCRAMFWNGDPNNKGRCSAGGAHAAYGFLFNIHYDSAKPNNYNGIQFDWRFCNRCWAMFWDGDPNAKGRCPAGGAHTAQGFMFGLYTQPTGGPSQPEWRFCNKCRDLFWNGDPNNKGNCPAGGPHFAQGLTFSINYDVGPQDVISRIFQQAFTAAEPALAKILVQQAGRADLIAHGFTLYDINLRLGTPDFRFTTNTNFNYRITNNYVYFKSTQPTVVGSEGDPAFEVHFDAQVAGAVTPGDHPKLQNAVASIPSITVKPRNVVGGAITTFVHFFQETDAGKQLIQNIVNTYLQYNVTNLVNSQLPW